VRSAAADRQKLWPSIVALLMLLNGCGTNNTVLEEIVEQVYAIEPSANVSIQNHDGSVLIYGSDGNELQVRAVKKAYSRERLNQIAIDVSIKPGAVLVSTKFPPQPKWALSDRSGTVDYTIVLPASVGICALDVNAGEVLLDSMPGRGARVRLGDGRIFARNCLTNLDLTMNRGALTLSYDWWEEEKFSAQATLTQGNAWIWLPSDAAFHLFVDVGHGKIANDFSNLPISANSPASGMRIDQIINGGGSAEIKIRVGTGNIRIGKANP
jgi:hypothetical protein